MKKRLLMLSFAIVILLAWMMIGTACSKETGEVTGESDGFKIFYLSPERNEIIAKEYELQSKTPEQMVDECIAQLKKTPDKSNYTAPIATNISIKDYAVTNGKMDINFGEGYLTLSTVEEVLVRAAIVKTLVQIPGIEYITFNVEGAPLRDAKNNVVGVMSKDSFVNNLGAQINTIENYEITLYYATTDGSALKAVTRSVYASTGMSMEKLVLTYLMQEPEEEDLQCVIPEGTKIISVATLDGVCLVSFDDTFLRYNYKVSEEVAFYSIINTLCEINGVNKVQISVNGNTTYSFRDKYAMDKLYERNLDCVLKEE